MPNILLSSCWGNLETCFFLYFPGKVALTTCIYLKRCYKVLFLSVVIFEADSLAISVHRRGKKQALTYEQNISEFYRKWIPWWELVEVFRLKWRFCREIILSKLKTTVQNHDLPFYMIVVSHYTCNIHTGITLMTHIDPNMSSLTQWRLQSALFPLRLIISNITLNDEPLSNCGRDDVILSVITNDIVNGTLVHRSLSL